MLPLALFHLLLILTLQTQTDTLTQVYSQKWAGAESGTTGGITGFLASNDLIFVVLTVSLIIWFVLLWFLIRLDRRISRVEQSRLD